MAKKMSIQKGIWFKNGLRFTCNKCGICCLGKPGVVWVNKEEMVEISNHLNIPIEKFSKEYLRKVFDRHSLIELKNGDCIMYENGCKIYPARPYQCKSFPFWLTNLETESEWNSLKKFCPGIDCGKLYSWEEIIDIVSVRKY